MAPPKIQFQASEIVTYIERLAHIPSPTGFTHKVKEYLIQNAQEKKIAYRETKKGAILYLFEKGHHDHVFDTGNRLYGRMIATHVDTLGAIVCEVRKKDLRISPIGGYPPFYVIGDYCLVHTWDGQEYPGTILPENPAVHVNKDLKTTPPSNFDNMLVRLDLEINTTTNLRDRFQNGNFVSLNPHFEEKNGFVKSRHLDDKASAGILLYLADLLQEGLAGKIEGNLYLYFNVTEETGQGIAGFPEIDELLIMDMGCVGKNLDGDEFSVSICMKDSSGPYHYGMTTKLMELAKKNKIAHKVDVFPYYGSDGSAALQAGKDIRVALVGPGVDASHGYERTHEKALLSTLQLAIEYLKSSQ